MTPKQYETKGHNGLKGLSRRDFLKISGIVGTAGTSLLLGFNLRPEDAIHAQTIESVPPQPDVPESFAPNVWLRIDPDNTLTVTVAKSEMGQGIRTTLAMLIAEEIDADWSTVRVEQAVADSSKYGEQVTWGSTSVTSSFNKMRVAGGLTRLLLLQAAAQTWNVDAKTLRTENSMVVDDVSGKRLTYGELTAVASKLEPPTPDGPVTKKFDQFKLVGTPASRIDTPAEINGTAVFGVDVRRPGMLYASIARCPVIGGVPKSFNAENTKTVPGVKEVIQLEKGVAVVAENTWAAMQGRDLLKVEWDEGDKANMNSTQIRTDCLAAIDAEIAVSKVEPMEGVVKTLEATYEVPYAAHMTMEPMNATAEVRADGCDVWVPTQHPSDAKTTANGASKVETILHVTLMGGGFGRRSLSDFVAEPVLLSKAVGAPVQVMWTREDDFRYDKFRPVSFHKLSAGLDANGQLLDWQHHLVSQPISDDTRSGAGSDIPYTVKRKKAFAAPVPPSAALPVAIWRSVNYSQNTFVSESFFDEVAAAVNADPLEFRLKLLADSPKLKAVLELAAEKAGWGKPLPDGHYQGVATYIYTYTNCLMAQIAEVSVNKGALKVHRVVCAVDCGFVVNPNIATATMEGAIAFGLTAAIKGEITVAKGRVQQSNFMNYPMLRFDEMPAVEVYFMPSKDQPRGLGEPGVPLIAPAVANAVFAATGKRIRKLPIRPEDLQA